MKRSVIFGTAMLLAMGMAAGSAWAASPEAKCKLCHSFDKGGKNKTGPNLYDILGKKAGQAEGYSYSDALKDSGVVWTEDELRKLMADPQSVVPGIKMPSPRYSGDKADAVIAFIKSQQ